jgi:hypothetical protein
MLYHGYVECFSHLSNCLYFPIAPVVIFVDVDKEYTHVRFFLMKLCHKYHNSMDLPFQSES